MGMFDIYLLYKSFVWPVVGIASNLFQFQISYISNSCITILMVCYIYHFIKIESKYQPNKRLCRFSLSRYFCYLLVSFRQHKNSQIFSKQNLWNSIFQFFILYSCVLQGDSERIYKLYFGNNPMETSLRR